MRHRRREGDAAAAAAARQRALRRGGGGQRGGDAGDDLAVDAGRGERLELFLEAAEDARVAALQANDALRRCCACLTSRALIVSWPVFSRPPRAAWATPVKPRLPTSIQRACGASCAQRRVGERIEQDDVGAAAGAAAPRTVMRSACAGAGADEGDARRRPSCASLPARGAPKRGSGSITSPW